ncbi:hypothetical protein OIU79_028947 [Salix purpurea]|uniref:Uncharacterized protein n=1 Tax=Salix purpurea TaxID=77065 RepID=A0A9Q1A382_SALPP|nr:hypothetical protein OIU79_028947 [Salix purpurea]
MIILELYSNLKWMRIERVISGLLSEIWTGKGKELEQNEL